MQLRSRGRWVKMRGRCRRGVEPPRIEGCGPGGRGDGGGGYQLASSCCFRNRGGGLSHPGPGVEISWVVGVAADAIIVLLTAHAH